MLPDGRTVAIKNGRWGFNLASNPVTDGTIAYWGNAFMPDIAHRIWETLRRTALQPRGDRLDFQFSGPAAVDAGSYALNKGLFGRSLLQYAAREMGDEEIYRALQTTIDERTDVEISGNRRRYPKLSVYGNAQHVLGRFGRKDAMREMIDNPLPKAWIDGPVLEEAPYPRILVAKAVSDGAALDLVLRPGSQPGPVSLGLSRLHPSQRYRVDGAATAEVRANDQGKARLDILLTGRQEIRVSPIC